MGQVSGMWAVWFRDHVHTDFDGQYAIFATRKAALRWKRLYGIPGCRVARLAVTT
jgi:hypothetical protein